MSKFSTSFQDNIQVYQPPRHNQCKCGKFISHHSRTGICQSCVLKKEQPRQKAWTVSRFIAESIQKYGCPDMAFEVLEAQK